MISAHFPLQAVRPCCSHLRSSKRSWWLILQSKVGGKVGKASKARMRLWSLWQRKILSSWLSRHVQTSRCSGYVFLGWMAYLYCIPIQMYVVWKKLRFLELIGGFGAYDRNDRDGYIGADTNLEILLPSVRGLKLTWSGIDGGGLHDAYTSNQSHTSTCFLLICNMYFMQIK